MDLAKKASAMKDKVSVWEMCVCVYVCVCVSMFLRVCLYVFC